MANFNLETLEFVKLMFDVQADSSNSCEGYKLLCTIIQHFRKVNDEDRFKFKCSKCGIVYRYHGDAIMACPQLRNYMTGEKCGGELIRLSEYGKDNTPTA